LDFQPLINLKTLLKGYMADFSYVELFLIVEEFFECKGLHNDLYHFFLYFAILNFNAHFLYLLSYKVIVYFHMLGSMMEDKVL